MALFVNYFYFIMFRIFKYLTLVGLFCLAGVANAQVNVAVIAPTSGESAQIGKEIVDGVRAAVDEINQTGGLLGEKVNLLPIEDMCDNSLSLSTAQMLALNKETEYQASAVIGPYCFNQYQAVTDTFAKAGIFQIIPTAVSANYAQNGHSGLVKMVGYQDQQAKDFFDFYSKHFQSLRVALISDAQHQDIAHALQQIFIQNNQQDNLISYSFEDYQFDYGKLTDVVLENRTRLAFILGNAESANQMARKLKIEDSKQIIFLNRYQVAPEFEVLMGDLAENCYLMGLLSLKDSPEFAETLVKLRLLGIEPEGLAVYGYSAAKLWAELVKKSGSFAYDKLAKTLQGASFNSGWGRLMFTNGNPVNTLHYSIYQYKDGEYAQVY